MIVRTKVAGRRKQLLDDLKERRGYAYWSLKEEALDLTVWKTHLRRRYEPVVRQITV